MILERILKEEFNEVNFDYSMYLVKKSRKDSYKFYYDNSFLEDLNIIDIYSIFENKNIIFDNFPFGYDLFDKNIILTLNIFSTYSDKYNIHSTEIPTIALGNEGFAYYESLKYFLTLTDHYFKTNFCRKIQFPFPFQGEYANIRNKKNRAFKKYKIPKEIIFKYVEKKLTKVNTKTTIPIIGFEISYYSGNTYRKTKESLDFIINSYFKEKLKSNTKKNIDFIITPATKKVKLFSADKSKERIYFTTNKYENEFELILDKKVFSKKNTIQEIEKRVKCLFKSNIKYLILSEIKKQNISFVNNRKSIIKFFTYYEPLIKQIDWNKEYKKEFNKIYSKI